MDRELTSTETQEILYAEDKQIIELIHQLTIKEDKNISTSPNVKELDKELKSKTELQSPSSYHSIEKLNDEQMDEEQQYMDEVEDVSSDNEYDWEQAMGSGYWDSNGGSPQWVPENNR